MDAAALVRRYYDALDSHEYDALEDVLAPEFVQRRPDRTFESRDAFVRFMREERPNPDTSHELEAVIAEGECVAVRGRVCDDGARLFDFADFFELDRKRAGAGDGDDGRIVELETYSR
ncbi:nuclear transport factor 2 family protein [Natronolimnohabitans innermongolicus]|uniref:SnoaL-like domain-containing protein n=1 Tax=Natronolimnohabitans innermongolicus JCM 12255 TaxID=1227499 RepID=L9WZ59_9EURY|nr:nuclear transport factor 2 family protein [Natronolimnohabitans innermongolicus]ELY53633.1 hypothetical protein C493_13993 [Natronolimnohabitans innermongolicus JCM 12255]